MLCFNSYQTKPIHTIFPVWATEITKLFIKKFLTIEERLYVQIVHITPFDDRHLTVVQWLSIC